MSQHRAADTFDGSSHLTCKTLMFHQGRVSRMPNADGTDSEEARLAAGTRQVLCIFQMITDAWTAAKTDVTWKKILSEDRGQRRARPSAAALCFFLSQI